MSASRHGSTFAWQRFFQRSTEPLFVLNRQGYVLFVNRAWEQLTGLPAAQAKRLSCRRPQPVAPDASWRTFLAHVLTPPDVVLEGSAAVQRRLIPARQGRPPCWWDVDFLPFQDDQGVRGVLGRVRPVPAAGLPALPPLPEAIATLRLTRRAQQLDLYLGGGLPVLRRLAEQVRLAASVQSPVLLVGAPGTGKKSLARAIHLRSADAERSFAALDCTRLPATAVATLLWGEEGALARAPLATVYLKEPSRLPRELQARLADWIGRPSQGEPVPRLLAGCSVDPPEQVRQGRLVDELYHVLAAFRIDVPALADRRDDLPHLVDRFLRRLAADGRPGADSLSPDAWEVVFAYRWPGNLRELVETLRSARGQAGGGTIEAGHLPAHVRQAVQLGQMPAEPLERIYDLKQLLEQVERRLIEMALRRSQGNKKRAAELLSVWRPFLLRRMKALGLAGAEE